MLNFSRPSARSYTFKAILIFLYGSLVKKKILWVLTILQFDYGFVMSFGHIATTTPTTKWNEIGAKKYATPLRDHDDNYLIGEFDRRLIFSNYYIVIERMGTSVL